MAKNAAVKKAVKKSPAKKKPTLFLIKNKKSELFFRGYILDNKVFEEDEAHENLDGNCVIEDALSILNRKPSFKYKRLMLRERYSKYVFYNLNNENISLAKKYHKILDKAFDLESETFNVNENHNSKQIELFASELKLKQKEMADMLKKMQAIPKTEQYNLLIEKNDKKHGIEVISAMKKSINEFLSQKQNS